MIDRVITIHMILAISALLEGMISFLEHKPALGVQIFTGEISQQWSKNFASMYPGHSERRTFSGETDQMNKKSMLPHPWIDLCVGKHGGERITGLMKKAVK
jgi:hypothetical protein